MPLLEQPSAIRSSAVRLSDLEDAVPATLPDPARAQFGLPPGLIIALINRSANSSGEDENGHSDVG